MRSYVGKANFCSTKARCRPETQQVPQMLAMAGESELSSKLRRISVTPGPPTPQTINPNPERL